MKYTVHDLFNVCQLCTVSNTLDKNLKQSAIYDSDIPVTLK